MASFQKLAPEPTREEEYARLEEQGIIPRNGKGQPMIWLPDGSKRVAYSRPSGLGDVLDDKNNLFPWHRGRALIGAMRNSRLLEPLLLADRQGMDWDNADGKALAKKQGDIAFKVGGGEDRADKGTSWHNFLEQLLITGEPGFIPDEYEDYVAVIKQMLDEARDRYKMQVVGTEVFGVFDAERIAGTCDLLLLMWDEELQKWILTIGDWKTSGTLKYSMGKFCIQLWSYSKMVRYDPAEALTGINQHGLGVGRRRMMEDTTHWASPMASSEEGFVFWIPSGRKVAQMVPINISHGAAGYKLVKQVKDWRNFWQRKAQEPTPIISYSREEEESND